MALKLYKFQYITLQNGMYKNDVVYTQKTRNQSCFMRTCKLNTTDQCTLDLSTIHMTKSTYTRQNQHTHDQVNIHTTKST